MTWRQPSLRDGRFAACGALGFSPGLSPDHLPQSDWKSCSDRRYRLCLAGFCLCVPRKRALRPWRPDGKQAPVPPVLIGCWLLIPFRDPLNQDLRAVLRGVAPAPQESAGWRRKSDECSEGRSPARRHPRSLARSDHDRQEWARLSNPAKPAHAFPRMDKERDVVQATTQIKKSKATA